jgi:16S rRNA A1518/A1519 N6-dimethyltransferase RsmA/KsgA/DIM1 with predicted DNA glycosylase/AP lyase activity
MIGSLLAAARLDPQRRAETLTIAEAVSLANKVWELRAAP